MAAYNPAYNDNSAIIAKISNSGTKEKSIYTSLLYVRSGEEGGVVGRHLWQQKSAFVIPI
jgi:hypothetical protein